MPSEDVRPIPDPTTLTTELVERTLLGERERIGAEEEGIRQSIAALDRITDIRFLSAERALEAAFAAQKEAAAKSEESTSKQLDALATQLTDVKERIGRVENTRSGGQQAWGAVAGIAGILVGVTAVIISAVALLVR